MMAIDLSTDHAITVETLVVALVSLVVALATAVFAWRTVKYGKDAVEPLEKTASRLETVAGLLRDSIAAAERVQKSGELLRQIEACTAVQDALLSISRIEVDAIEETQGDPDLLVDRIDSKSLVVRSRIVAAVHQLPPEQLPKVVVVSKLPTFDGAEVHVEAARREVTAELDRLQRELQVLGHGASTGS